ncbi:MAG: peptidoglycan-binding domain-containing protein [Actinomycetota bacterium]
MRGSIGRPVLLISGLALVLASCGGDDSAATTTTEPTDTAATTSSTGAIATTTSVAITASTTTETTLPSGPPLSVEGDRNETVEAIQFLLNCNAFGDLTVDGAFGPATLAAVEAAQRSLGRTVDGAPDEETMAELSRSCSERRRVEGEGVATVVGNAAPEDPEAFSVALLSGDTMSITVTRGTGLTVTVTGADGAEVAAQDQSTWAIEATQDYLIEVGSPSGPVTFALTVEVTTGVRETGDWILATDGVTYKGTELALGTDAQAVIDKVFDFLGHGVRGAYDEFDTGWYSITDPADMGLRGIFIEGFAFLFFGPDPNNPDRPETFARHRFVGPTVDRNGVARPANYATTAEGITVGDTLADLKAAYGGRVRLGSNDEEYWYRLADSHGELCFYFDTPGEPTDYSPISEIASECRTG